MLCQVPLSMARRAESHGQRWGRLRGASGRRSPDLPTFLGEGGSEVLGFPLPVSPSPTPDTLQPAPCLVAPSQSFLSQDTWRVVPWELIKITPYLSQSSFSIGLSTVPPRCAAKLTSVLSPSEQMFLQKKLCHSQTLLISQALLAAVPKATGKH